jgi:tetratricopeptide (TPR) repeat protein
MSRALGKVLQLPRHTLAAICRHPLLTLFATFLLAAGVGLGVRQYALHQWRAAQAALKEDRPADARGRLRFCLRVWPRSPDVHLLAARAARMVGDLGTAEVHLNRCIELQDGASEGVQLEFLLMRVQTGELDGQHSPVGALFDAVQKGHPDTSLILDTIAQAYIKRLRYKPAFDCLNLWVQLQPDAAKPYQWRGLVRERLNNHKGAMEDYRRALELDPELLPVRLRVAEMLLEDKQAPEALPHLERLMRQAPDDPRVQARMGMCRYLQGRSDEARRLMEGAIAHLPKDPALHVALANLDLQEGRATQAEARLRFLLEAEPSDTEALFVLASALRFQNRTEEATAVLADYERKRAIIDRINDLLKDKADNPTATANDYAEIGRLFFEISNDKFGVYWSERALEMDGGNQTAHSALAAHYERKGDAAAAAAHRRNIRTETPIVPKSAPDSRGNGK